MDPLDVAGLVVGAGSKWEVVADTGLRRERDELLAFEKMGPELVVHGVGGETGLGVGVVFREHVC